MHIHVPVLCQCVVHGITSEESSQPTHSDKWPTLSGISPKCVNQLLLVILWPVEVVWLKSILYTLNWEKKGREGKHMGRGSKGKKNVGCPPTCFSLKVALLQKHSHFWFTLLFNTDNCKRNKTAQQISTNYYSNKHVHETVHNTM